MQSIKPKRGRNKSEDRENGSRTRCTTRHGQLYTLQYWSAYFSHSLIVVLMLWARNTSWRWWSSLIIIISASTSCCELAIQAFVDHNDYSDRYSPIMLIILWAKDIESIVSSLLCRTQGRKGNPVIFHSTALDLSLGEEKEQDIWKNILSQKQKP